nr:helix-turn-helix transcriptional regulator [Hyphomonas sp. Mor2]
MQLDHHLGEKLRQARHAAGYALTEAADQLNISDRELQHYESGTSRIASRLLSRAARTFGVEIRWFFDAMQSPEREGEDNTSRDDASTFILQSLRSNKTLSQLCEALRESDYGTSPRKFVA